MFERSVKFSRRRFLKASSSVGFGVVAAASGAKHVFQVTAQASYAEAPDLASEVAAGSLPPVEERLPLEPVVVTPYESIGQYGGVWRTGLVGGGDNAWLARTIGYDGLTRWSVDWAESIPNVAKEWSVNEDATQYTFTLREGMKWSDGTPFTSADIEFYINDFYRNSELNTSLGNNPRTIEVVDDYTFTITWEFPNGFALAEMAQDGGQEWVRYPKHYLSQFHKDHNPDGIDALISENGAADWVELFRTKGAGIPGTPYNALWQNVDLPRLHAWVIQGPYADQPRVVATRNAYYWKVDTEGNQLPYINEVHFDVLQDNEVLLLKALNGELDFHDRHINTNTNKSVLFDSLENAQSRFVETVPASMNSVSVALNLTHKDPLTREIFQNLNFRVALSHAINRQEIIDTVFVGQGEPWQLAPRREQPFFNETLAKQYTEYDADLANQLLDEILPDRGGDGYRLRPDGSPLVIAIEVATGGSVNAEQGDSTNLIANYWQAVGINASAKPEDRNLLYTRKEANDADVVIWGGDGGARDALYDPRWYFPFSNESNFAQPWRLWYQKPANPTAEPEEPSEAAQQQMALYDQLKQSPDEAEQIELFKQILEIAQQEFYAIGIVLPINGYAIVKNNMRNVPEVFPEAYVYMTPGPTNPQTYYYE